MQFFMHTTSNALVLIYRLYVSVVVRNPFIEGTAVEGESVSDAGDVGGGSYLICSVRRQEKIAGQRYRTKNQLSFR